MPPLDQGSHATQDRKERLAVASTTSGARNARADKPADLAAGSLCPRRDLADDARPPAKVRPNHKRTASRSHSDTAAG
jgi:hypothetical protein